MRRLCAVVLLLTGFGLVAPRAAADQAAPLAVGARAPDFMLGDHHERPFRLAEALGRRDFVVLAFYVKAFTRG